MFKLWACVAILIVFSKCSESNELKDTRNSSKKLNPFFKMSDAFLEQLGHRMDGDVENDDDYANIGLCFELVNRQNQPLSSLTRTRFILRTIAVVNCVVVADVVTLPRTIVRDYRRAYRRMTEKSTSRGDYAKQIFSLPFTFLKSIFYQPARTIRSIYAIAIGSVMTFPAIGGQ